MVIRPCPYTTHEGQSDILNEGKQRDRNTQASLAMPNFQGTGKNVLRNDDNKDSS